MNAEAVVKIEDLSFRYYGSSDLVLRSINLEINSGEIVLIAGHSGSGKSTLLRAINGLIPHQHAGEYSGKVAVGGLLVESTSMSELSKKVGYIFQNPENQIFMFTVERDIAFGLENLGFPRGEIRDRVDWAMDLLQVKSLELKSPHELSDGQKQRVAIAGVVAMKPSILILDEPTSLLDPFTARSLVDLVKELRDKLGITVLIVEHRLDLVAKICDRIVVIDRGQIAFSGRPRNILSSTDISNYGVTEPTIVKLAKLLALGGESVPIDAQELAVAVQERFQTTGST